MALRAGNIGAEEGAEREAQIVQTHARIAQKVARGAVLQQLPVGGHHGVNHFIPRDVVRNLALQPVLIGVEPGLVRQISHAHHVGEVVEKTAAVTLGVQQLVDHFRALRDTGVSDEFERLFPRWNASRNIEINPPNKLLVRGQRVRLLARLLQAGIHQHVNLRCCLGQIGIGGNPQSLRLQCFRHLLVSGGQFIEGQPVNIAIADLQKNLAILNAPESRLQLASLSIDPGSIDSVGIRRGGRLSLKMDG